MSIVLQEEVATQRTVGGELQAQARGGLGYLRRNPKLVIGLSILLGMGLFVVVGHLVYDVEKYRPLSVPPSRPPSWELPFGSDTQGRDLFATMIAGAPLTLRIGLVAGFAGIAIGTVLGFVSAYYGGAVDAVVRGVVDIGLTIPGLLVLIIIAISFRGGMTVDQMALTIAVLSWVWPTRTIRSQVLTMRERAYVHVARLSGMSDLKIIFREMMPNLLPYLAASLVGAVSAAILASIGLEALGLGPMDSPTIGMTIYWVIFHSALLLGMWWWFLPPLAAIVLLFLGLFGLAAGLDEWANPRLRKAI